MANIYPPPGATKSFQRGKFSVAANVTSTATIAAVTVGKARTCFLGSQTGAGFIELTNSTTITGNNSGNANPTTFSWEMREEY